MKSILSRISIALIAVTLVTTVVGCKKGENDPALSLKTRKGRITGEWKLVEGSIMHEGVMNGTSIMGEVSYTSSTQTNGVVTLPYTETITIGKDGTYEKVIQFNGSTITSKGNWYFSGKVKKIDLKKKEAIILSETESTSGTGTINYEGLFADRILLLDQLKNKRLVFKGSSTFSDSEGSWSNFTYNRTFEKQ